ncbi:MAG: hypothetical protein NE334_16130 [Lentisphaeraceae bacterium]|nr:hypothetical protein [Lentisphaeraceae bacterium]
MNLNDERRIHRLLLQREREFTAVWRAECEINKTLGAEYPFLEPPALPSLEKRPKKKSSSRKVKIAKLNSLIRPLKNFENAYKLTYTCQGEKYTGFQNDTALIRQLVPLNTDSFAIESVEVVVLKSLEDYEVIENLWNKEIPFSL